MTTNKFVNKLINKLKNLTRLEKEGEISKIYIAKFLPKAPVVVEAGAHAGFDTREMSKLWPAGYIHAFEPLPKVFVKLQRNTRRLKNVTCYPIALSDRVGTAKFFASSGASDASSSLLEPKEHLTDHTDVFFSDEIEVKTTTLDAWAQENSIHKVDFLWLDMQGYELATLKAATQILKSVSVIHIEVFLKESYKGVPLYLEVREWLESQGFRVEREELPWPDAGNVLFVR